MSQDAFPLTTSQSLIWTGQLMSPDVPLYNMAFRFDLKSPISAEYFRTAFQALVDANDALRLVFSDDGTAVRQRIREHDDTQLQTIDLSDEPEPESSAAEWMQQSVEMPFDLSRVSYESALLKLAGEHWVWYINLHHLVTDAWSVSLMYRQMANLYRLATQDRLDTAPDSGAYRDYLGFERDWRATEDYRRASDHWNERASAAPGIIPLYGRPGARRHTANTRIDLPFGAERSQGLHSLEDSADFRCLSVHLTRFNLLTTAVLAFLYRVSGQSALTIGTPAHNRTSLAFRQTVGLFMEMFPFSARVDETDTFLSLFKRVVAESQTFLRYAQPGTSTPVLSRHFNVVLNYIHASFDDFDGSPAVAEWLHPGHVDPGHDLRIQLHDLEGKGQFLAQFDCNDDSIEPALREACGQHFLRIVDAFLEDPNQTIGRVALTGDDARQRLLSEYNRVAEADTPAALILERFRAQAHNRPDAPAARFEGKVLSYAELDRQSDRVATCLIRRGVGPDVPVGIHMKRGAGFLIAVLAVFKAGGGFVPLESTLPPRRLEYIIEDAGIALVIAASTESGGGTDTGADWVAMEQILAAETKGDEPPLSLPRVCAEQMAYTIYTSGSTGYPKGVVVQHGPLAAYVDWAHATFAHDESCDFPLYSAVGFDLTITSVFVPLISGGCVVIYPEVGAATDLSVLQVFEEDAVDVVKLTPAHLALVLEQPRQLLRIRTLILGGENLQGDLARRALAAFGDIEIFNEYGPTEGVVGCMVHRFDAGIDTGAVVPIGVPASHQRIYVLDAGHNPLPAGVTGELFIAGDHLARGYLNRADLTSERFLADPFYPGQRMYRTGDLARFNAGGLLECLGRVDEQVKLGAVRIEPAEVQQAMLSVEGISDCVVDVVEIDRHDSPEAVHFCTRCGLSSDYPGATFDAEGVCQLCTEFEGYRRKADVYFDDMQTLSRLLEESRERSTGCYDCIALLSGGKDSTYALYRVAELGPRILAITLDNGYISDGAKTNIQKVVSSLGIDHRFVSTPAMNAIFTDSLERHSNVCHGCFKTIYTLAVQIALDEGIPSIVTGLSRGQFFETRLTPDLFKGEGTDAEAIDRTVLEARKAYHHIDDAVSRLLDVSMFDDEKVFEKVRFIDFYRYCDVGLDEVYRFLDQHAPWTRPADTGRSTNCLINDAGIYVHKRKTGFHNYALPYSWDVRMAHKTREAALDELNDQIDVGKVHQILHEIGYREDAFFKGTSGRRMVAYYVGDHAMDESSLREQLADSLTEAMIPSYFVPVDHIPLTGNGKVDRDALPLPATGRPQINDVYRAPQTPVEKALASIWKSVLRIDRVGLSDNYYALGGDSISAIQIASRAKKQGLSLFATDIFEHQTVAALAGAIGDQALPGEVPDRQTAQSTQNPERFSMAGIDEEKLGKLGKLLGKGRS